MKSILVALLIANAALSVPASDRASRVDRLLGELRVIQVAPAAASQLQTVELAVPAPADTADVAHGPIPTCDFVPVKGGPQQPYCHHH